MSYSRLGALPGLDSLAPTDGEGLVIPSRGRRSPRSELLKTLKRVAPGTELRAGVDSILRGQTGALIVVGDTPEVLATLDGGFKVDAPFTPSALYELSKMDGAIVLSSDCSRIVFANVHLSPDPSLPSEETGIRHRTAERLARQTGELVLAVSSRRSVITLYKGDLRYSLREIGFILEKANEAVEVLERYRSGLNHALASLTALELEDLVTVADFAAVLQRAELVLNVADEIEALAAELGTEGHLVSVQMSELVPLVEGSALLVIEDYASDLGEFPPEEAQSRLKSLSATALLTLGEIARATGHAGGEAGLAEHVSPRGARILHAVPRLPKAVADRVVARFGNLQRILAATLSELDEVEGVGEVRARALKDNLRRMREQTLLGRAQG